MVEPTLVDARDWPYICYLQVRYPTTPANSISVGTGCLIGERTVLTAGHVVYNALRGGWATVVQATLGGESRTTFVTNVVRTTREWIEQDSRIQNPNSAYDVGVVVLPKPASPAVSALPFAVTDNSSLAGMLLNVAGYPITPPNTLGSMYGARSTPASVGDFRVTYPIRTREGQSGGPVYTFDPVTQTRTIRAVHTSFTANVGSSLRITPAIESLIKAWLTEFGETPVT